MKIYMMTDIEGVAGVVDNENWCLRESIFYREGRTLLTREANAAIEGLFKGGATEIQVCDGHGQRAIDPLLLDSRAKLLVGPSTTYPAELDDSFDGICWVGQHAKAGTPYSHITHTQGFHYIDMRINGLSIGEYGQQALGAMELGVPAFFASGELAFCREAEALTPGVITVSVKEGLLPDGLDHLAADEYRRAKLGARHLSPEVAEKEIRKGAELAIRKLQEHPDAFTWPDLKPPFKLECEFRKDDIHDSNWKEERTHDSSVRQLITDYLLK